MLSRRFLIVSGLSVGVAACLPSSEKADPRMRIVRRGDVNIATQSFGRETDPPVLMIMGATASMLGWPVDLCTCLADKGFFVIRFDHRDTGKSTSVPLGQAQYSVEDLAQDALAVLDGYGLESAHLVGMSLGGLISQMIALDQGNRVRSLALIASEPLGWDGPPMPEISPELMEHFGQLGDLDWQDRNSVTGFLLEIDRLNSGNPGDFDTARRSEQVREVVARSDDIASMFNHASVETSDDWTGAFRRVTAQTVIFQGQLDPIVHPDNAAALHDGIAGSRLVSLPESGHELRDEDIPEICDVIAANARSSS